MLTYFSFFTFSSKIFNCCFNVFLFSLIVPIIGMLLAMTIADAQMHSCNVFEAKLITLASSIDIVSGNLFSLFQSSNSIKAVKIVESIQFLAEVSLGR